MTANEAVRVAPVETNTETHRNLGDGVRAWFRVLFEQGARPARVRGAGERFAHSRPGRCMGYDRRVWRLPVPLLRSLGADPARSGCPETGAALGLERLPVAAASTRLADGDCCSVCVFARPLLGDARSA